MTTVTGRASRAHPVAGLLLAAGAGRRYGRPKALVDGWVAARVAALRDAGCDPCVVVLGAAADEARPLVPAGVEVVVAPDWEQGASASLRAGLRALEASSAPAVAVVLVDTPGLTSAAVARVAAGAGGTTLARATYAGTPGHPVVLGRAHWEPVARTAHGDDGARAYLAGQDVVAVECGDVGHGRDHDEPEAPTTAS